MFTKEQVSHDLAVALAAQYAANELARGEYEDMDVYKAMSIDAATVYTKFNALLLAHGDV